MTDQLIAVKEEAESENSEPDSFVPGEDFGFTPRPSSSSSVPEGFDVNFLSDRGRMDLNMNQWQRESLYQKFDPLVKVEPEFKKPPAPMAPPDRSHLSPIPPRSSATNFTPPKKCTSNEIVPQSPDFLQSPSVNKPCQKKITKLVDAAQLTSPQVQHTKILIEYENSITSYIQKVEEMKDKHEAFELEKVRIIRERDQANEDLRNVESAFAELHKRYERMKELLANIKYNEDALKNSNEQYELKLNNRDDKILELKKEFTGKLEKFKCEKEKLMSGTAKENQKLRILLRKEEMKVQALENDLEQKGKENIQLNNLCDEFINGKVVNPSQINGINTLPEPANLDQTF